MPLSKLTPTQLELRSKTKWHLDTNIPTGYKTKTLNQFLNHLKETAPTPKVDIKLTLHNSAAVPKKLRGSEVAYAGLAVQKMDAPALVSIYPGTRRAEIHLAIKNRDLASSLGSLAHEYWHIVQTFVQNRDLEKEGLTAEHDANTEAGIRTREFRETYCLIDPRK